MLSFCLSKLSTTLLSNFRCTPGHLSSSHPFLLHPHRLCCKVYLTHRDLYVFPTEASYVLHVDNRHMYVSDGSQPTRVAECTREARVKKVQHKPSKSKIRTDSFFTIVILNTLSQLYGYK